jgi:DNA repair exonuclease SbcCD ATPase subunit
MSTSVENSSDRAFYMLTEQLGRIADELSTQRSAHLELTEKVSSQSALIASLAERITAHNKLLEERKISDHNRIVILEEMLDAHEERLQVLEQWKWKAVGAGGVLLLASDYFLDRLLG